MLYFDAREREALMQLDLIEYHRVGEGTDATAIYHVYLDEKYVEGIHVSANKRRAILHISKEHTITLQEIELLMFEMRKRHEKIKYSY